jgi:hypothetical protein
MDVDTDTPLRAKHSFPKHDLDDIVYEAYGFSDDHKQEEILEEVAQKIQTSWQSQRIETPKCSRPC